MPELAESLVKKLEEIKELLAEIMELNKQTNNRLESVAQKLDKLEDINRKIDRTNYLLATRTTEQREISKEDQRFREVASKIVKILKTIDFTDLESLRAMLKVEKELFNKVIDFLKSKGRVKIEGNNISFVAPKGQRSVGAGQKKSKKRTSKEELRAGFSG